MTNSEIISLVGFLVSMATAIAGIYIARSTRRKNDGDAAKSISDAAANIVEMREKDAAIKQAQIDALQKRVDILEEYVAYLHDWIERHVDGDDEPQTFKQYMEQKTKNPGK